MTRARKRSADPYAVRFARKGGKARAKKLSSTQRRESARQAALARWAWVKKQAKG